MLVAAALICGCGTTRMSDTLRTGTEQILLSAAIVMTFLLCLSEPGRIAQSVLLAGAASAAVYGLFASLLQVRLPTGWLGF